MNRILFDLRYSLRSLLRAPALFGVIALTLALGVGVNTAVFSVVYGVLLRPLPYRDPGQLVLIRQEDIKTNMGEGLSSYANFGDWRAQSASFEGMAAYADNGYTVTINGEPEKVPGELVTPNFFEVMGVAPALGRTFNPSEEDPERQENVVVISFGMWQRAFGGDRSAAGKSLTLDKEEYTVIGVMPETFKFPSGPGLWVPMKVNPRLLSAYRANAGLRVIGRLKPGVREASAQGEMDVIAARLREQFPEEDEGVGVRLKPLREQVVGDVRPVLLLLWLTVAGVLLLACANIVNLLLSRTIDRQREVAMRLAFGASRARIVQLVLCESFVLCIAGAAGGLLLARLSLSLLLANRPRFIPRLDEISLDGRVLLFALAVAALSGLFFGLTSARYALKTDVGDALKKGARSVAGGQSRRLRQALVISEVCLAFSLLILAGLTIRSFRRLQQVELGFNRDNVLVMTVSVPASQYGYGAQYGDGSRLADFFGQLEERAGNAPGVLSAGEATYALMSNLEEVSFEIEGRPTEQGAATKLPYNLVSPGYFKAVGLPVLQGRGFEARDARGEAGVVVINAMMAARYWKGENPIGRRLKLNQFSDKNLPSPWLTVVGVVGDMRRRGPEVPATMEAYLPGYWPKMDVIVHTQSDASSLAGALRAEVRSLSKDATIVNTQTLDEKLAEAETPKRFWMQIFTVFGATALILACVGVYGVISYTAAQRTKEMAIRMALGARPRDIMRLMLSHWLKLIGIGVVLGAVAALMLSRFVRGLLFGIEPTDLTTFLGAAILVTLVALLSCLLAARRTLRADLPSTLRYE